MLTETARHDQASGQPLARVILTIGDPVSNAEVTSYHRQEEFGKGQKELGDTSPNILPTSQNPSLG